MAINPRFINHVWHVGETATPFEVQVVDANGTARTDIASATFTLIDTSDGTVLIDAEDCQSVTNGLLSYRPGALEMATACKFLAQFVATLSVSGYVLPTFHIEGEIEDNL